MMNSTVDEEEFPANPFRSDGGGSGGGYQQPQFAVPPVQQQQQQAPPPVAAMQQQQQQQPFGNMQQQQQDQLADQFSIPPPPPVQQPATVPQQQPPQFSSGGGFAASSNGGGGDSIGVVGEHKSWWQVFTDCFKMDTYKAYFDVDTMDIQNRIQSALMTFWIPDHFRQTVVGTEKTSTHKGPDLYGPIWITFTLMFIIAVTSNFSAYMHYNGKAAKQQSSTAVPPTYAPVVEGNSTYVPVPYSPSSYDNNNALDLLEPFQYDIEFLCRAGSILSFFVFLVPTLLWAVTNICLSMSNAPKLVEWVCLYGYSMVPFLPATLVCMLPWPFLNWVVLMGATGASGVLVIRNVSNCLIASDVQKAPAIIIAILASHVVFFFTLKLSFYHHT